MFLLECSCNVEGSSTFICNGETGKCDCKSELITGHKCDESIDGYFGFPDPEGNYLHIYYKINVL